MAHLQLVSLLVADQDEAIAFFVGVLGFDLVEDSPATTSDGRPKRWVVVRPPGAVTGLLLARADGPAQEAMIGQQFAGRVGLFLEVDDVRAEAARLAAAGVRFARPLTEYDYGTVAVFEDVAGNLWDLIEPRSSRVQEPVEMRGDPGQRPSDARQGASTSPWLDASGTGAQRSVAFEGRHSESPRSSTAWQGVA